VRQHWRLRLLGCALAGVTLLSACGGSDSSGTAKKAAATDNAPGTAVISSFDVPDTVECGGKTSTTVPVTYATSEADQQELYVDGRLEPGTDGATGSLSVPVHCDPLPHTFVLIAYDAQHRRTAREKKVVTNA